MIPLQEEDDKLNDAANRTVNDVGFDEQCIVVTLEYKDLHQQLVGCILANLGHFEIFLDCREYQGTNYEDHLIVKWSTKDEPF